MPLGWEPKSLTPRLCCSLFKVLVNPLFQLMFQNDDILFEAPQRRPFDDQKRTRVEVQGRVKRSHAEEMAKTWRFTPVFS